MFLFCIAVFFIIFLVLFVIEMAERKFTRGLNKPGMAAALRESVSQVVRESAVLNKPLAVQPIDFESFVAKNKTLIQNDPQRELLIYPTDDVSQVVLPRKFRTTSNFIPTLPILKKESSSTKLTNGSLKTNGSPSSNSLSDEAKEENGTNGHHSPTSQSHGLLLTRQALHTYQSNNHLVHYKYSAYSCSYHELPKNSPVDIHKEEVYEVDADPDRIDEEMTRSQADSITKQGYLYKGPDTASDRMFAHIGSKSFKRRYCYLRQEVDGTYILELHKDEKQCEAKATIVMDFCTEVVQNPKRGRFCFELRMTAGHKSFTLAADNESDMQDWLTKLQSVLSQNKMQEDTRSASLEREKTPSQNPNMFGTLKGLDQSMNPQLIKYGRETDISIAQSRREHRRKLFNCYALLLRPIAQNEGPIDPYREQFGQKILIKCDSLKFRLQTPLENCEKETFVQAEPYFTSLALYDAKNGRKLTENFYFDLNSEHVRDMMVTNQATNNGQCETNGVNGIDDKTESIQYQTLPKEFDALPANWLTRPKQAILSVTAPHPDVFLVVKIEKILQGGINNTTDAYLKAGKDPKMGLKLHKNVKTYSQKIGHYRMPFAWAARPLFRLYSSDLDAAIEFPAIYRQEANKLKDEDILKLLAEYRKPDKFSKLTVIPGFLKIMAEPISELPNNSLTTTLMPLKPFPIPPSAAEPSFEIAEFSMNLDRDMYPYTTFVNHLFVYPQSLSFDSQKLFSRARNIAVTIEVRESDAEGAKSIPCIYGRPGQSMLLDKISCPVLHHSTNPTWYEEIKIRLPLNITANHHLLFSFVHVSCDLSKRRDANTTYENAVGYSWMPLLSKGKINVEEQVLPVAACLPAGYLAIQPLGLGKGQNAGPDIQWIDNQRPIFSIIFRLESTVLTTDQHLHNLFVHSERLLQHGKLTAQPAESETCKILKAAHAIQVKSVITFLPTILNQLFTLLVNTNSEDIALNVIRLLINLIHTVAEEAGRKELLNSYVKFVFQTTNFLPKMNGNTVHSELCHHLPTILNPNNTDFLVVNKFMKYSNIFFDIIVKSMAQHLLHSGRIRMHRNERFTDSFSQKVENLFEILVPYLFSRHKDLPNETQILNKNLSVFIKRCLTFMDRGFVFKLIRLYLDRFSSSDQRVLHEYKFAFLQEICTHEHYVPLNLPILLSPNSRQPNLIQRFTLSEEFCRQHFLAGVLLQEVKSSLNEVGHIRKLALSVLKELLAKHDLDDRYQGKGQAARLAVLYIPWLGIVMENRSRIFDGNEHRPMDSMSICTSRYSTGGSYVFGRDSLISSNSIMSANSTPKLRSRLNQTSPCRTSVLLKDTNYLAAIAGQQQILGNGHSTNSLNSDCSALSNDTTILGSMSTQSDTTIRPSHARSVSMAQPPMIPRLDKFNEIETKDLLICFLFVVKHLSQEHMILWWQNCTESETIAFFGILDYCLINFRYVGKKNIVMNAAYLNTKMKTSRSHTLPARVSSPQNGEFPHESGSSGTLNHSNTRENLVEETTRAQIAAQDSSLAAEVGLTILDCMGLYTLQFRDKMLDGSVLPKLAQVYLRFLQLGQSENLSKHVFAALRAFINNFSAALFRGNAALCGQIVYELLKCCDSRLTSIRQDACAVLYLLMRSNFEFSGRKGLTRVHLQVIISVSQMIGNVIGLNNARFQESLSLINSYATSDKAMKGTGFPIEVKDLTKRVRTVLMATAQMQAHHMDPERLIELQQSLANSYSTPELRHTWLVTMARNHEQNGDLSEAAMCNLHIAALIAEYLKLKGSGPNWGAESFGRISRNIPIDEKGLKLDSGTPDSQQYSEMMLYEQLKDCADYLDRAERYECLGELYRLIIPILENRRDYTSLAQSYEHLAQSYSKINEVNRSGKRMLGRFYRVVFFGQIYFEEDSGVEYIYKEPKLTSLSEISERLYKQYKDKLGADNVKMIQDSSPVNVNDLDPKIAYIQVTHTKPYFCKDELETRQNFFEQNHDVDTFQFETPFTKSGTAHGTVEEQWKRRTILTTMYSFPYVLKRIPVKHKQAIELNPIEVAIDEMQNRVVELEEVVMPPIDVKKLQLRLQGSVAVQVNAGPLAYANAFLSPDDTENKYSEDKVDELKDIFREFVSICNTALQVNGRMISSDQREYHAALKDNYEKLCTALSDLLNESFLPIDESNSVHRNSLALFSAISGAPNNSSTA